MAGVGFGDGSHSPAVVQCPSPTLVGCIAGTWASPSYLSPLLIIYLTSHLCKNWTPAGCFNWWDCGSVVLNWRQMVLTHGPHMEVLGGGGQLDWCWKLTSAVFLLAQACARKAAVCWLCLFVRTPKYLFLLGADGWSSPWSQHHHRALADTASPCSLHRVWGRSQAKAL